MPKSKNKTVQNPLPISNNKDQDKKDRKKLSNNRIDLGDRGIYDKRNKLNDLTGKEWKFMSKSVVNKSYPPDFQHKLRKKHGGQKPPLLCADIIKTFTKEGEVVLDPFMGVGGTLLGAVVSNRKSIGIEINKEWVDIYKEVCKLENVEEQETHVGNSEAVLKKFEENSIDFILTDVPYWNMDKLKKTRSKSAVRTHLSKFNSQDMQTKQEWLDDLVKIFDLCYKVLKPNKYLAIFIGDLYRGKKYHILSADLAYALENRTEFVLKANLIWYDVSKNLHVYGQPFAYIPSMIHQNILILRKDQ